MKHEGFGFGARLLEVIETQLERRGEGTKESPMRCITQYWTLDGELLAEVDPCAEPVKKAVLGVM